MTDDILDKDDKYSPIRFSRNYFDEPTKVQPYWISKVSVKNMVGVGRPVGTAEIDFLGKPALTAPNGYGKTLLLKIVNAVMELVNGEDPLSLNSLVKTVEEDDWDRYVRYHHLFDEVVIELAGGRQFKLIADDASTGSYIFEADGNVYPLHDGRFEVNPPQFTNAGIYMLPTARLNSPEMYIYQMLAMVDGNVNYDFINKWYNVMMLGIDPAERPSNVMKRYDKAPFAKEKSYKENSKAICKWIDECMLSHGELELFMQLLAMSSGCKVVLIDSAEIGFHPGVQTCYMHLLSSLYQKGIQVLFSTHSPTTFDLNFSYSNDLFDLFDQKE